MTADNDTYQHFADARHALYVGWVCGLALKNGLDAWPVDDDAGNHTDRIAIRLPTVGLAATIELVVPYPPEDWSL